MISLLILILALAAAFVPLPAHLVERWYSEGLYPSIQTAITPLANRVPVALLDIAGGAGLLLVFAWLLARVRKAGVLRAAWSGAGRLLVIASVVYLAFLGMWGCNYRRVPLQEKLEFSESRVTAGAARALALEAVDRLNATHRDAAELREPSPLEAAFAEAQRILGSNWRAVPGVPKRSVLGWYFRRAAIDGMTDPFFLEIVLNPDLLPVERPFVLAHEWAHLAGHADEAEANFVAWLTCVRGDAMTRYSGWLALYGQLMGALPQDERREIAGRLADGPRRDLAAIAARYQASSPVVRAAARDAYDAYLKANRVDEGIASYDGVVQLVLGTTFSDGWAPQLR